MKEKLILAGIVAGATIVGEVVLKAGIATFDAVSAKVQSIKDKKSKKS